VEGAHKLAVDALRRGDTNEYLWPTDRALMWAPTCARPPATHSDPVTRGLVKLLEQVQELTRENDFLEGTLSKAGLLNAKR
jgi:hypothetical protein